MYIQDYILSMYIYIYMCKYVYIIYIYLYIDIDLYIYNIYIYNLYTQIKGPTRKLFVAKTSDQLPFLFFKLRCFPPPLFEGLHSESLPVQYNHLLPQADSVDRCT